MTLPCAIGDVSIENSLCDIGASINLMPTTNFNKLGVGELKPSHTTLQLADQSIRHTRGFVQEILVKVGKFTYSAKFYILEMDEDRDILILPGKAFLATCGARIYVQKGELNTRLKNKEETFGIYKVPKRAEEKKKVYVLETNEVKHLPTLLLPRAPPKKTKKG